MNFLNTILLGGASAALIPLVIHLLSRARPKTVQWGAMHLLALQPALSSRRVQWDSWLLLLLRILIPIVFAIALARPVLTRFRVPGYSGQDSIQFVIDNSLSMLCTNDSDTTVLDQAKKTASNIVTAQPSATLALHTTQTADNASSVANQQSFAESLNGIQAFGSQRSVLAAVESAIRTQDPSEAGMRQVVVISDFQAADWSPLAAAYDSLRSLLQERSSSLQLLLLRADPQDNTVNTRRNVSIHMPPRPQSAVFIHDIYHAQPIVRNHSTSATTVYVTFSVDGDAVESRTVDLAAGSAQQLDFACTFADPAWHHIVCSLMHNDALSADNQASEIVQVFEPLRVLISSAGTITQTNPAQNPEAQSLAEAQYLQLALAPYVGRDAFRNHFRVNAIVAKHLDIRSLQQQDALVLVAAPALSSAAASAIEAFVTDGGGLVVFSGPDLDATWYNDNWVNNNNLLPLRFGNVRRQDIDTSQLSESNRDLATAAAPTILMPSVSELRSPFQQEIASLERDLGAVHLKRWTDLVSSLASESSTGSPVRELLRLSSGETLAAMHRAGKGNVVQCGLGLSEEWSDWPLTPVFLPLVQSIVLSAVRWHSDAYNVICGETIRISRPVSVDQSLPLNLVFNQIGAGDKAHTLLLDSGQSSSIVPLTLPGGVYKVTQLDSSHASIPPLLAVSNDPAESELSRLNDSQVESVAEQLNATFVRSVDELLTWQLLQREGKEIWPACVVALLGLLFAEMLLAGRIARGDSG